MRIYDFAKELTKETGKQVSPSQIIQILSKKKEGLKMTSEITPDLMEYAKINITGKSSAKPAKKAAPAPAAPAGRKPAAKRSTPSRGEGPKERPAGKRITAIKPKEKPDGKKIDTAAKKAEDVKAAVKKTAAEEAVKAEKTVKKPAAEVEKKAVKEAVKDTVKDEAVKDIAKEAVKETTVEAAKDTAKETAAEAAKETSKETVVEAAKESVKETVAEAAAEKAVESVKEAPAEAAKESVKETSADAEKSAAAETAKEAEKDSAAKETANVAEKETVKAEAKDNDKDAKESVVDTAKAPVKETADKPARSEKTERSDRSADKSGDRTDRGDRPARNQKNDRSDRSDRGDRTDRSDRSDRGDRFSRGDRNDRSDRAPRGDRNDRSDRPSRGDRNDRPDRGDRPARDGQKTDRRPKGGAEVEESLDTQKKSSSRKGDKSRDKEKEARRENRETRTKKMDDRKSKKNNLRDMEEMVERRKKQPKKQEKKEEETIKTVTLPEVMTLSEFASKIKQPVNALIKKLFLEGKMYTVNTEISYEEAELIALEFNIICEQEVKVDIVEEALKDVEDPEDSLVSRPPVVCVMGHVDHGKTSLLDAIRKTSVTADEAGGITQHIGAYTVAVGDKKITFLDTPGHEAFTAMRLRGAMATDIAILVVAADDGVMPQTVEAINHAKAAGIEIIVAVNKIDKPSANVERVKQELTEYGLIAEDWGGSTVFAPVSAHTHEGIDNLLEMILLTSDLLELKANPNRKARGVVIEAKLDKGRGAVATLLVQKGTLKVGDFIAIGESHGRVRAMTDDKQKNLKEAKPSMPVEIIGLDAVPNTGEIFIATDNEKEARNISNAFITRGKENLIAETKSKMSLDDIFSQMQEGTLKELNIIIKADVQGSVEALKQSLLKLSNNEIVIKCIHSGVGAINESDVSLAAASDAIIIGFNVRPEPMAKQLADSEKVDLRLYRVIYNAIDDIESAMKGMLDPIYEEKVIGHVTVRQTFKASGIGTIAGVFVDDGAVERNAQVRLSRRGDLIWEGKLASLKRFNDDAKEVKAGYECGIVLEDFNDIREDDKMEVYKMVEVPRE